MSVTGFSVQHDGQMSNYKELERAVLASELQRKEEQRQKRLTMGLPDVGDNRGILSCLLRKQKRSNRESMPGFTAEKTEESERQKYESVISIHEFLQSRPQSQMSDSSMAHSNIQKAMDHLWSLE